MGCPPPSLEASVRRASSAAQDQSFAPGTIFSLINFRFSISVMLDVAKKVFRASPFYSYYFARKNAVGACWMKTTA